MVGARRAGGGDGRETNTASPARLARSPRFIAVGETAGGQANWEKLLRGLGQGHTQLSCPYVKHHNTSVGARRAGVAPARKPTPLLPAGSPAPPVSSP